MVFFRVGYIDETDFKPKGSLRYYTHNFHQSYLFVWHIYMSVIKITQPKTLIFVFSTSSSWFQTKSTVTCDVANWSGQSTYFTLAALISSVGSCVRVGEMEWMKDLVASLLQFISFHFSLCQILSSSASCGQDVTRWNWRHSESPTQTSAASGTHC